MSPSASSTAGDLSSSAPDPPARPGPNLRLDREPEVFLDLARLISPGSQSNENAADTDTNASPIQTNFSRTGEGGRANFVGESWYANYVVSTSAAGHAELHRTVNKGPKQSITDVPASNIQTADPPRARQPPPSADLPPPHLIDRLLEAYFRRFHMFCPILDRKSFLEAVRNNTFSITLLKCVLFVASIHCDPEILHVMGYPTRLDAEDDLFAKACASFDADNEADRTTIVLSAYLLHYWFGKPTSYRDSLWWLANSIRSAQCMGYHRSTKHSKMSLEYKTRFKRIWWCLYVRDRQVSFSTGTPMVINEFDHDVEDLAMDDLREETPQTARYMIAQVTLNKTASNMYFLHCAPTRLGSSPDFERLKETRKQIQGAFESWYADVIGTHQQASHHHLTLTLKVCY
jgi:hypothetical protein